MRSLTLTKSGTNKLRARQFELKSSDFEESVKSLSPGEWCAVLGISDECWVGFINPLIDEKYSCAQIVDKFVRKNAEKFSVQEFIFCKIKEAHARRSRFKDYEKNSRIFYGTSDGLPGLIIDQFENAALIQINTAGLDRYRDDIKTFVANLMGTHAYLLDNSKYREKESLPTYGAELLPDLHVLENGLKYTIRSEVIQKVGFYYDHRENRFQLMNIISRLKTKPVKGLDLFCYSGAWGMSALKAGVTDLDFVDQGNFEVEVQAALSLNGFESKAKFFRSDVFKYLDECILTNMKYDLILCDPPAFAKSALQKPQALEGYTKLHRKVLKCLSPGAVVAFSSCTHYVDHSEFQKNVLEASLKENRKIQLIYNGIQGLDHPVSHMDNKSNYIKSYFYIVE